MKLLTILLTLMVIAVLYQISQRTQLISDALVDIRNELRRSNDAASKSSGSSESS